MTTPKIYATCDTIKDDTFDNRHAACDALSVQLLNELTPGKALTPDFDSLLNHENIADYPIETLHMPLKNDEHEYTLSDLSTNAGLDAFEETFSLAQYIANVKKKAVGIIVHYNDVYTVLQHTGKWKLIVSRLNKLLTTNPDVQLYIKNACPTDTVSTLKALHANLEYAYEHATVVQALREELGEDKIFTCLDTYQALKTELLTDKFKHNNELSVSLRAYFSRNRDMVGMLSLTDLKPATTDINSCKSAMLRLKQILNLYTDYGYTCPIMIEVPLASYKSHNIDYAFIKDFITKYFNSIQNTN